MSDVNGKRRLTALLICVGMGLFLLTSSAYIVLESGHDCHGDDCEVCERIARLDALLSGMAHVGVLFSLVVCAPAAGRCLRIAALPVYTSSATPVGLKVRLND